MRPQSPVEELRVSYEVQPPPGSEAFCKIPEKEILLPPHQAEAMASRAEMNAFMAMVNANQNIISKVCRLFTRNRTDHKDLFQEISYQLWKAYPVFGRKSKASTWLYSVALKTAAALYRKRGHDVVEISSIVPDIPVNPNDDGLDDEAVAFIRRQAPTDRSILLLMLEGYTNQDIAPVLGLSEEAIAMRVLRLKRNNKDFFQ